MLADVFPHDEPHIPAQMNRGAISTEPLHVVCWIEPALMLAPVADDQQNDAVPGQVGDSLRIPQAY